MAEREQIRREHAQRESEELEGVNASSTSERNAHLKGDLESLLDEIDEVLESNAEEFVKSYVQKGGE